MLSSCLIFILWCQIQMSTEKELASLLQYFLKGLLLLVLPIYDQPFSAESPHAKQLVSSLPWKIKPKNIHSIKTWSPERWRGSGLKYKPKWQLWSCTQAATCWENDKSSCVCQQIKWNMKRVSYAWLTHIVTLQVKGPHFAISSYSLVTATHVRENHETSYTRPDNEVEIWEMQPLVDPLV